MFGATHDNTMKLPNIRDHFIPDPRNSQLYSLLCGKKNGKCTFPSTVTLETDLQCNGDVECGADILRAVKIVDGDVWGFYTYVEPPCARLQFFGEGKIAMNHGIKVCADPTVASNIGAQCCAAMDDEDMCPTGGDDDQRWYIKHGRNGTDEYERHTGQATHGDLCRFTSGHWTCPVGCKMTEDKRAPYCVLDSGDFTTPCHLDRGVVSSGGGECLYVAEPMTYATAERRCAAEYENGGVCAQTKSKLGVSSFDGSSKDWQGACAGFEST